MCETFLQELGSSFLSRNALIDFLQELFEGLYKVFLEIKHVVIHLWRQLKEGNRGAMVIELKGVRVRYQFIFKSMEEKDWTASTLN